MDKIFDKCYEYTKKNEGGWSNHPADSGGATKYGITLATLKNSYKGGIIALDYNKDGKADIEDLKILREEEAKAIYYKYYFKPLKIYEFKERVGIKLYDHGVNMGTVVAAKLLQRALLSFKKDIVVDGFIGVKTITAANYINENDLLAKFVEALNNHYQRICENNPSQICFLNGWLNRASRLP